MEPKMFVKMYWETKKESQWVKNNNNNTHTHTHTIILQFQFG